MKQFISFVRKEFYHIWRDKRTMFILLVMPIMQIIIFGFALTNEVKNAKIARAVRYLHISSSQSLVAVPAI